MPWRSTAWHFHRSHPGAAGDRIHRASSFALCHPGLSDVTGVCHSGAKRSGVIESIMFFLVQPMPWRSTAWHFHRSHPGAAGDRIHRASSFALCHPGLCAGVCHSGAKRSGVIESIMFFLVQPMPWRSTAWHLYCMLTDANFQIKLSVIWAVENKFYILIYD